MTLLYGTGSLARMSRQTQDRTMTHKKYVRNAYPNDTNTKPVTFPPSNKRMGTGNNYHYHNPRHLPHSVKNGHGLQLLQSHPPSPTPSNKGWARATKYIQHPQTATSSANTPTKNTKRQSEFHMIPRHSPRDLTLGSNTSR